MAGRRMTRVRAVARGDGDEIFVTGFTASEGAGERDLWVRRFTPDGAPVWSRTLGTARHDEGFDLAVLADGSVAVTGHFWTDPARGYDVAVARLSAGGEMIWQRSLDRAPFEVGDRAGARARWRASGHRHDERRGPAQYRSLGHPP